MAQLSDEQRIAILRLGDPIPDETLEPIPETVITELTELGLVTINPDGMAVLTDAGEKMCDRIADSSQAE